MEKSYKIRIYPNERQRILIHKTFGCCRYVYNYYLNKRDQVYETEKRTYSFKECSKDLTKLKQEKEWLKEPDKHALQNTLKNLDKAYVDFFNNKRNHPRYKSKNGIHRYSYKTQNGDYDRKSQLIMVKEHHIKLPKLGWVRFRDKQIPMGQIINAIVSQEPNGEYYVSIYCKNIPDYETKKTGRNIGIDLGTSDFCIFSDGTKITNPKYYKQYEEKITKLHRELDRKTVGSANWEKARIKLAKAYNKISCKKKDYLQKLTTEIVKNNDVICIETLDVSKMINKADAETNKIKAIKRKAIVELSMFSFAKQLTYKTLWHNKKLIKVDQFYPSSQLCHVCGHRNSKVKDLEIRYWVCPKCKTKHDRDINAAINILNEGLKQVV